MDAEDVEVESDSQEPTDTQEPEPEKTESVEKKAEETEKENEAAEEPETEEKKSENQGEGTTMTNDRLERIIYLWILSFHISVLLNWLGFCSCWGILFITLGVASSTTVLAIATIKVRK